MAMIVAKQWTSRSVDTPEAALRDAHALEMQGDHAGAETILRDAVKRWKREPEFRMRHAACLRKLGREKAAMKAYRKVLKTHPMRADAAEGVAACAQSLGKAKTAERFWARAQALGTASDVATVGICRAKWLRGQRDQVWALATHQFHANGRQSKTLHAFLVEISPVIGERTPELDLFSAPMEDAGYASKAAAARGRAESNADAYGSDSLEAMAGVSAAGAIQSQLEIPSALLDDTGAGAPGIDLSAVQTPSPAPAPATDDLDDIWAAQSPNVALPDDLLDFD